MAGEQSTEPLLVRDARPEDVPLLLELLRELAEYERLSDQVRATEELFDRALFSERPAAEALIAERAGEAVGYALYFPTFSTFLAIQGVWLEDLFVRPESRGAGVGTALLRHLFDRAGDGRVEWAVLDWNEPSIAFYRRQGARPVPGWTRYRWTAGGRGGG